MIFVLIIQVHTSLNMPYEKNYNFFSSRSRNKSKTVLNSAKQALLEFYTFILNLAGPQKSQSQVNVRLNPLLSPLCKGLCEDARTFFSKKDSFPWAPL